MIAVVDCETRAGGRPPLLGVLMYYAAPIRRRVVVANLRRAYGERLGEREIRRLAQGHYAHLARLVWEFARMPLLAPRQRNELARVENIEAIRRVYERGRGVLILAAHLGNWEVATVAALGQFPQYRGRFHVLRRRLWPDRLDRWVTRRFVAAGIGVLPKVGALDRILARLAAGDALVFVLDQHAVGRDGVVVDFFGQPASTWRSLAILARSTGLPVVPMGTWREPDGRHVVRFEEPLPVIPCADASEGIRLNTRAYNAALERMISRHPEQWLWMHRRWKTVPD
jgi:KDO2-lipid IV(A) lauroyltransferase